MAVIDGEWLSKEGLTYFWSKIKSIFITMPQAYGDGTPIESDSDLNSYTTPGIYYATVTVARTLTNAPYTMTGFRLMVEKNTLSGSAVFQTLTPTSRTYLPSEYKRVYENNSWGPWNRFTKQTETNVIANLGAKNLFNINATPTVKHTSYNLTDDTLTVTSSGNWASYDVPVNLPAGDYIFTTTISNFNKDSSAGATSVRMRIAPDTSGGTAISLVTITGNGVLTIPFTWPGGSLAVQYSPNYSSTTTFVTSFTASNSMIRRAEITDDTFQPYAPTNRELYETRFASKTILPNNVDLNDIKTGGIYNGVNSTGNSAIHMPVATGSFNFVLTVIEANEFIIQIFKQLNSAGDPNLYIRRFYIYNSDWDSWYQFTGTQV